MTRMMKFVTWVMDGRKGRIELNNVPGYEDIADGFYLEGGRLYGLRNRPYKGSWVRSRKYPYNGVTLKDKKDRRVHKRLDRIIATAYVDGRTEVRTEVDHINGKHNDDRPENLRWVSRQENMDFLKLRQLEGGCSFVRKIDAQDELQENLFDELFANA